VGYAEGEYDAERSVFRVRERNAHTWVEIYFPGYGWVEFEPTASEPPLIRPERTEWSESGDRVRLGLGPEESGGPGGGRRGESDEPVEWDIEPLAERRGLPSWLLWAVPLTLVAVLVGGWWAAENWGFRRLSAVETAYARLLRFGRWLGHPPRVSDTPLEWAEDVSTIVPEAREPMGQIVDLYVSARFARGAPAAPEATDAWRQARPALWRRWLRRVNPFFRRYRSRRYRA
jgi:hypothetical protein